MEKGAFPALIHCFTASAAFAEKVIELGAFISLSGIVTFKNATDLQTVARDLPADRLLIENRQPLPRPGTASRKDLRTGIRRRDGSLSGSVARR